MASQTPVSPTTGEPVGVVASRNRLGLYLLIVIDAMGSIALVISYSYLWALNVNNGWAPPGSQFSDFMSNGSAPSAKDTTFASDGPFWIIAGLAIVMAALAWWSYRLVRRGDHALATTVAGATLVVGLVAIIAQWWQITTLPFGSGNGTYASAVLVLLGSNIAHLFLVIFLLIAITNRIRIGLVNKENPSHAQFVAIWMTWIAVAFVLGAFITTIMKESPNANPTRFGGFEPRAAASPSPSSSPSPSASPAASGSASPSASPS